MLFSATAIALYFGALTWATPVLWEGRAPCTYGKIDIDQSFGPYFSGVKGTQNASHYFQFLSCGCTHRATPIWHIYEQPIRIAIDNSSIFTPGSSAPQLGFRRSEIIAQPDQDGNRTALDEVLESGITAFHFSVHADTQRPLNYTHEYQALWIELSDGSHIFDLQTGTPFNTTLSSADSHVLRIRAHDGTVLFHTPFLQHTWHNFAVVIDWDKFEFEVFYSTDADPLEPATMAKVQEDLSAASSPHGVGEFHFGVLKLPLIDASNTPAEQADVVHFGIQEGSREALIYSGMFVESTDFGISVGYNNTLPVEG
ncbi:hypothetical protein BC827DRAFT_413336 [Russula dissimulans]|nr:hypothetical protein BC827DRAFT_413336 [Russula dissimulans]